VQTPSVPAQQIPEETQCLLVELEDGAGYALLLPLIDNGAFRATLRPAS
jgi:raffinose synthase